MPRSKTGKKRACVDSENLLKALEAITANDDTRISLREACKVYKISLSTLSRQLKYFKESGKQDFQHSSRNDVKKVFTDGEEKYLVKYITKIAKIQYGLTKKGVREVAYKYAVANNKKYPKKWDNEKIAGEEWMRGFMKRHNKDLSIRKPEPTSLSRSTSFNKNNVNQFFDNIQDVHKRFGPIPPGRIWNTDETGLTTVQNPRKIVAPKGMKQIGRVTSAERGQLITMIAAVNAIGNHIPPFLIFPRVNFKDFMLKGAPPGSIGAANPSGWSTEALFLQFLVHFIAYVKPSRDERVILLMDNHETHLSVEAIERASEAGIVMVTFPPHTSHKLQPLDLTVYGPLKALYSDGLDAWHTNNPGKTFNIYCIAEVLGSAYARAFSTNNIVNGFKKSGVFPFDRNVFSEEDFLVSYVTDRCVPLSTPSSQIQPQVETGVLLPADVSVPESYPEKSLPLMPTVLQASINNIQAIVLPEEVVPLPKAAARKVTNRGRKSGSTRIMTDTPQKEEIKRQKENKQRKNIKPKPGHRRSVKTVSTPKQQVEGPTIEEDQNKLKKTKLNFRLKRKAQVTRYIDF